MPSTETSKNIKLLNGGSLDGWWGPYADLAAACAAIPNSEALIDGVMVNFRQGKVVGININGKFIDHHWPGTNFSNAALVKKAGDVLDRAVSPEKLSFVTIIESKNRFNANDTNVLPSYYLDENSSGLGNTIGNAGYNVTGFIAFGSSEQFVANKNARSVVFYNENFQPIQPNGLTFPVAGTIINRPTPAAVYIRACFAKADWAGLQIEKNNTVTSYTVYAPPSYVLNLQDGSEVKANFATDTLKDSIRQFVLNALSINTSQISNGAVTAAKAEFLKDSYGKNRFNIADFRSDETGNVLGKYVVSNSGLLASGAYNATHFIPVPPSTQITISYKHQIAWYTSAFIYITGSSSGDTNKTQTSPSNAAYLRCSVNPANWDLFQAEINSIQTAWEKFNLEKILKSDSFSILADKLTASAIAQLTASLVINTAQLASKSVTSDKAAFIAAESGRNRFNPGSTDVKTAFYLNENAGGSLGNLTGNNGYNTTGFIDFGTNSQLTINKQYRSAVLYDANKVPVRGVAASAAGTTFTKQAGEVYLRVCVAPGFWSTLQVEFGNTVNGYEDYSEYSALSNVKVKYTDLVGSPLSADEFLLWLPPEICVAVGRTIELYHSQISWCGNIDDYHFFWSGVGSGRERKWTVTGTTAAIGSYALTLKVFNNNMVQVAAASTTVKIVASGITVSGGFDFTCVGDSLTNNKWWENRLIASGGGLIRFAGTRVDSATLKHEGRSGVDANWYLNNSSYTFDSKGIVGNDGRAQNLNPFWNPNTGLVDFDYYKSNYNISMNVMGLFAGTNGIQLNPAVAVARAKSFIDAIRSKAPNMPFLIFHTLFRANQDGIGKQTGSDGYVANSAWKLEEDRKVFNLQVALYEALKNYTKVWFVPISVTHDSKYNFGAVSTPVNPRSTIMELLPIEATHPQNGGYEQFEDIIWSIFCAHQQDFLS